jgi:hypothetical protein
MNFKDSPQKVFNNSMIKSILLQKKELEVFEKELLRKNRYRIVRLNSATKRKCVSITRTPDLVPIKDVSITKEYKIPKHIVSDECGLENSKYHPQENFVMSVYIKKVPKNIKSFIDKTNIVNIPEAKEVLKKFPVRSNTPVIKKRKNSWNKSSLIVRNTKLSEWTFTPL